MHATEPDLRGLTATEIVASRQQYGSNRLYLRPRRHIGHILAELIREPAFMLLALACSLYFAIGDHTEAWLMVASVIFVSIIEIVQEYRSERALEALRTLSQPKCRVIRDGQPVEVPVEELVVGDLLEFDEGDRLGADGVLVRAYDLTIDESVLTGESLPAGKSLHEGQNRVYQGTTAASGLGLARVTAVGAATEFGQLGKSIESIESEPTPLQRQIDRFVRQMMGFGLVAFVLVFAINYHYVGAWLPALLFSLAFALALVPEEIPVAFATFMGLGAWRMAREQILVKQPKTVESLGSATVICLDKTGTITENRMTVADVYESPAPERALEYAMWASEVQPFDAMEKAIHTAYGEWAGPGDRRPHFRLVHDYPLGGQPPMMTHIHENTATGERIVAAKGAVERIVRVCRLGGELLAETEHRAADLAERGYRVLAVASAVAPDGPWPAEQDDFAWTFQGLIALFDPPKTNVRATLDAFYEAGIAVKMITGDHPATALNIARQAGLRTGDAPPMTGEAVLALSEADLRQTVQHTAVFARMFPQAKLRVIEALKANGEVVAMTGDGVNDGPALKAAHIGVAMGQRGTEIAKGAASMVLLDDDLGSMVRAVALGRRIYSNLRKAIRYIISIHLPIILVVLLPLVFGWPYLHLLTPIHVIFLELIMDPTCAVAFENEPTEANALQQPPRRLRSSLFTGKELTLSLVQGIVITGGIFALYHYAIARGADEATTRAYVFTTMLASNIFLTLANRSFDYPVWRTIFYPNRLLWAILVVTTAFLIAAISLPWVRDLFSTGPLGWMETGRCLAVAAASVFWVEVLKINQSTPGAPKT